MNQLPTGVVTFALTDVEGSTRLWEDAPDVMVEALGILDLLVAEAANRNRGFVIKSRGEGDSHFLVFNTAAEAVTAAALLQRSIAETGWPTPHPIKLRIAIHTGAAELIEGDYYGPTVNRTARLRAIAHGGQTIISLATHDMLADVTIEGVTFEALGEHRLKDLARPEAVFQVVVAGLPANFPRLTSLMTIPNNLPEQLTELIGRQHELEMAKELLTQTRLLTLLAPGGTGKTRLAIQIAADLANQFRDGVFFIGLADIGSSRDIVQSVAEALGLGLSADEDTQIQLLNYLATKQQLLVFDNFEHVKDGAMIVSAILHRAPRVSVLATSREKLSLSGETIMPLTGLETTWQSPEEAYTTSGVQLFIDAARRAKPDFAIGEEDLDALARILQLIDGMPLAILLAASWVDMLGVGEIADEITKSFDFLESHLGDAPDRHRSVRTVFDYSWALLDDNERAVFSRLSVCRGGFTRESAESIAGAELKVLSRLVAKSLVTPHPESSRYTVHEMLRQFAESELARDERESERIQDGHASFYADLVTDATALLTRADQVGMSRLIETDIDNVRAAWRRSLLVADGAIGLQLLRGLYFLYEWRGWYPSAVSLFGEAAKLEGEAESDDELRHLVSMSMATRAWFQSLLGQAEKAVEAALEVESSLPDSTEIIDHWIARQCLALAYGYTGAIDAMEAITQKGIELTSSIEDSFFAAGMKNWRSYAAVIAGDLDTASRLLDEGMAVFVERGDHYFMTWNLWLQGLVALSQDRPPDAIDAFTRQVEVSSELGYLRGRVVAYEGLGDANVAAGRMDEAFVAYVRAMVTADQMGMVVDMLGLMTKIGRVWATQGRHSEAVSLLETVRLEPLSDRMTFTFPSPIRETAVKTLADLASKLDPSDVRATLPGTWEMAAKNLIDSLED